MDPAALGGREEFTAESTWIAEACLKADPLDKRNPVRLPGQAALEKKRHHLKNGVELEPAIMEALVEWSATLGVAIPIPTAEP